MRREELVCCTTMNENTHNIVFQSAKDSDIASGKLATANVSFVLQVFIQFFHLKAFTTGSSGSLNPLFDVLPLF